MLSKEKKTGNLLSSKPFSSQLLNVISEEKAKLDSFSALSAFEDCLPPKIKHPRQSDMKKTREGTGGTHPIHRDPLQAKNTELSQSESQKTGV